MQCATESSRRTVTGSLGLMGADRFDAVRPVRLMHMAHLINRYDFIDNVVRNVNPQRFQASAVTFGTDANIKAPAYAQAGIPHFVLNVRSRRDYPAAAVRLARLLARERVDLIHAHHFDPGAIAWLATRLHPATRLIVGRHYSDDHHAYLTGLKRRGYLGAESLVNSGAARIVAPSSMIREILVDWQQVPAQKVVVIPYPFDSSRYQLPDGDRRVRIRAELGLDGAFAVATVGRILPKKGHRYLVQALGQLTDLPELVWVVLGDGPGRAELEAQVRREGFGDQVRFVGWRTDALQIMATVDAIVQPTLQEAYSQVMVEAQWMGTPLVITEVSGATDLVESGETGLLVGRADASALAAAIRRLARDESLRRRLAEASRARVASDLTVDKIIPRYEQVYEAALAA
jgi:L-malate glycosyltransferase